MTDIERAEEYRKSLKQKLIDEDEFERLEMFDENVEEALADDYCKNEIPFDTTECGEKLYTENDLKQAFIAGNKSKEEQLKKMKSLLEEIYEEFGFGELVKIRNDLPTEIQEIIGDVEDV